MSKLHSFFRSVWSQKRTLKIYLDGDLVFYSIDFNELPTNYVFDEEKLYDEDVKGIPTFLIFQNPSTGVYENYTYFESARMKDKQPYALLYYGYRGSFSTRAVSTVNNLKLGKIVMRTHRIDKT